MTTSQGDSPWSLTTSAATKEAPISITNLHRAVQHSKPLTVRKILNSRHGVVDVLNHAGTSPLMQAAVKGDSQMVGLLLSAGADVNIGAWGTGRTALMLACYNGHVDIAQQLREKGALWEVKDRFGCTALHYAVEGSQLEAVLFALGDGADIEATDSQQWTPLMNGIVVETPSRILQVLIQRGASVNAVDSRGVTCLMHAVLADRADVVKLLLDSGADPTHSNDYQNTALGMARAREKKDIVRLLTPSTQGSKEEKKKHSLHRVSIQDLK
ncbi:fibronectin type 3 and ankyrin repeat domains 1 protein [Anabrus simplex]|uniref:fibronectin type 3 and ankyrin repeat domains 1 protein n=1 Tax=Anabrus simplex TaxID=316456 RepID=UPI0034DD528A